MFDNVPDIDENDLLGSLKAMQGYLVKLRGDLEYRLNNIGSENINEIDADIVPISGLKVGKNVSPQ